MYFRLAAGILLASIGAALVPWTATASREVTVTPEIERAWRAAIERRDYVCPQVKLIYDKGTYADGSHFTVWCGPPDRPGVYERLVYDIIISPSGRVTVRPQNP